MPKKTTMIVVDMAGTKSLSVKKLERILVGRFATFDLAKKRKEAKAREKKILTKAITTCFDFILMKPSCTTSGAMKAQITWMVRRQ